MIIIPLMSSSFQRSHNVANDKKTLTVGVFCCFFNELNGHLTPRPILAMQ